MRFSEEHPVRHPDTAPVNSAHPGAPAPSVGLPDRLRPLHTRDRLRARVRVRRAAHRPRADSRALPVGGEDPGAGRGQQLPRRDVQLHRHVQLPDVVPDCCAYERERGR